MADRTANIDLVFRNGLKDFEVLPPYDIWNGITPVIRKRKPALTWLRAAAVTTLIAGSATAAYYFGKSISVDLSGPAITLNQDERPEGKLRINNIIPVRHADENLISEPVSTPLQQMPVADVKVEQQDVIVQPGENKDPGKKLFNPGTIVSMAGNNVLRKPSFKANNPFVEYKVPETTPANKMKRWSVGAVLTPSYYSETGKSSSQAASGLTETEQAAISYSGGLALGFNLNKKLSLQMGLYYTSLNQEIDGVKSYSGFSKYNTMKGPGAFTVKTTSGPISTRNSDIFLSNGPGMTKVSGAFSSEVFDPAKSGLTYLDNTLFQNFNYLEIPLMLRYKIVDRIVGVNVVGGFSYGQLISNSAYSVSDGTKYVLGETEGLTPVTVSSSFGLGMEYRISGNISLNLEPTFRYFLTPMSSLTTAPGHTYTFGVLSGLSWKF